MSPIHGGSPLGAPSTERTRPGSTHDQPPELGKKAATNTPRCTTATATRNRSRSPTSTGHPPATPLQLSTRLHITGVEGNTRRHRDAIVLCGGRAVSAGPRTRGAQGETEAARTGPPRPRARDKNRGKEPASRCPGERAGPHLLPGAARFHVGTPEAPATRCAAPSSNAPCTEGPHKNLGNGELPPSAHSTSPRRGMIDVDRLSPPVPQEQGAHR